MPDMEDTMNTRWWDPVDGPGKARSHLQLISQKGSRIHPSGNAIAHISAGTADTANTRCWDLVDGPRRAARIQKKGREVHPYPLCQKGSRNRPSRGRDTHIWPCFHAQADPTASILIKHFQPLPQTTQRSSTILNTRISPPASLTRKNPRTHHAHPALRPAPRPHPRAQQFFSKTPSNNGLPATDNVASTPEPGEKGERTRGAGAERGKGQKATATVRVGQCGEAIQLGT